MIKINNFRGVSSDASRETATLVASRLQRSATFVVPNESIPICGEFFAKTSIYWLNVAEKHLIKFWKNFTDAYVFHKWFRDAIGQSSTHLGQ